MKKPDHLTDNLLLRSIDDELSQSEIASVEEHLSRCEDCRHKHQQLRSLSGAVESAVAAVVPSYSSAERESLARALDAREQTLAPRPQKLGRRLGWGMGLAAALAVGILFGPQWSHRPKTNALVNTEPQTSAIEVDGETFVTLPYSDPDLPIGMAPHIVQMQVPVSSLADAGIIFEPISNEVSAPDRSVLADVLLGVDGQPLGVHVLTAE